MNIQALAPKQPDTSLIQEALAKLNRDYETIEAHAPRQGYRVLFKIAPTFEATLIPMGKIRTYAHLSGVPKNAADYAANQCPFCLSAAKVMQVFEDQCRAVVSLRGRVLVIPDQHYAHWFETPLEEQVKLIQHALEMRKQYPRLKTPLELHCGSAGYQTVFHTHLHTGISQ